MNSGHTIDIFAASLDQSGILEMRNCCENTGGALIQTDTFDNPIYKESLKRFFKRGADNNLSMGFNASLVVQVSRELRVCGAIGPVTSLNYKGPLVAETEVGYGGTTAWKINALAPNTTVAIYFDAASQPEQTSQQQQQQTSGATLRFFQFTTAYQHSSGQYRVRVTTKALNSVEPNNWAPIAQGFDQEAAAIMIARLAVFKAESEYLFDVLRWVDRVLIRLVCFTLY